MRVKVIDRDSLKRLCETNLSILPNVGETINVNVFDPHDRIIVTELVKREWVVTDGYGMEGYVVLVVKVKK